MLPMGHGGHPAHQGHGGPPPQNTPSGPNSLSAGPNQGNNKSAVVVRYFFTVDFFYCGLMLLYLFAETLKLHP